MMWRVPLLMTLSAGLALADDAPTSTDAPTTETTVAPQVLVPEPATSRYLYAPSAIPLGKGHWYFSQKELFFSGVATGLTDNVSVLVGSIVPALIYAAAQGESDLLNAIVAVRGSAQVGDRVWIGGGAEAFAFNDAGFAMPFVNATYGQPDHHVTLASGAGVQVPDGRVEFIPVVLAGEHRVSEYGALVSENWLIVPLGQREVDSLMLFSIGWRFIADRLTADVAIVNLIDSAYVPIPWLDIAYHWGPRRK